MKKFITIMSIVFGILGAVSLSAGIYMFITLNSMALLKLSTRTAYYYIILNKWLMLGGGALFAASLLVLFLKLKKKQKPVG
ncbi:MAG: hypothetical protein N2376_01800 [Clostridia bacterium]|nr:hypothetical protein [Clostridia bacterium]